MSSHPEFSGSQQPPDLQIAIGHYGVPVDISGVTTWLGGLVEEIHRQRGVIDLLVHDLWKFPLAGSFVVKHGPVARSLVATSRPRWTEDAVTHITDFLNSTRPKVFLPQGLASMYYAAHEAERSGLPWILTMHSDDPFYWGLLSSCCPQSNIGRVVVVSDYLSREALRRGYKTVTIPYGVQIPLQYARYQRPFRVVYSGRVVEEQKRISLVLETMALACEGDASLECLVIGAGAALEESRKWVLARGLADRIQFAGSLPQVEVISKLTECHALLLMSDFEGLPVALLEAMAAGVVPIVRSIRSGVEQVVRPGKTGYLVTNSPVDAASAIVELARDDMTWNRLSLNARELIARDYELKTCYRKWIEIIKELSVIGNPRYPLPTPEPSRLPAVNPAAPQNDQRKPSGVKRFTLFVRTLVRRAVSLFTHRGASK